MGTCPEEFLEFRDETEYLRKNWDEMSAEEKKEYDNSFEKYAEDEGCRRGHLLGYFGEQWPHDNCGGCDSCLSPRETYDATLDCRKFLSCVFRIRQHGGFTTGLQHIADVLCGANTEKIRRWKHETLSTYGIGSDTPRAEWVALGRQLLRLDLIRQSQDGFSTVALTEAGRTALKDGRPFLLVRPPASTRDSATAIAKAGDIPCDEGLFAALRAVRKNLADTRDVPSYVVFSDVSLRHMAREYPSDPAAMLHIPGVGERKLADFGTPMLETIAVWIDTHPQQTFAAIRASAEPVRKMKSENELNGTALATLERYKSGVSIDQIAKERGLAASTVESHLAKAVEGGEKLDPRAFYSADEEAEMRIAFEGHEGLALKPVFEKLGERVSYGSLRLFQAFESRATSGT